MSENQIKEWLRLALQTENFSDFTFKLDGNTGKADGYLGKVAFVTGTSLKKTLNLVIKTSAQSPQLRKQIPIKLFFQKEIHVYTRVKPAFEKFQQEMGADVLDFLPKCYGAKEEENIEVIILENLKSKNYGLWDRMVPMDFEHLKVTLETFGKWHGFSTALRHKRPGIFSKLVENNVNPFPYHILHVGMVDFMFGLIEAAKNSKRGLKEEEIQEWGLTRDQVEDVFVNWYHKDPDFGVISHGDCWTNNFMFKYQEGKKTPLHACFLDWQCSGLASPIMDLSFFIYTCVDTEIYKKVEDLLQIYYKSFSKCLEVLGCDPSVVFPLDKLLQQWKSFSLSGLILGTFILKFSMCDADDAPDFAQTAEEGKAFLENLQFSVKDEDNYHKRVTDNILHYVRNSK